MNLPTEPILWIITGVVIIIALLIISRIVQTLTFKYGKAEVNFQGKSKGDKIVIQDDPTTRFKESVVLYGEVCSSLKEEEYDGLHEIKDRARRRTRQMLHAFHQRMYDQVVTEIQKRSEDEKTFRLYRIMYMFFMETVQTMQFDTLMQIFEHNHLDSANDEELMTIADVKYDTLTAIFYDRYSHVFPQECIPSGELKVLLKHVKSEYGVPEFMKLLKYFRELSKLRVTYMKRLQDLHQSCLKEALAGNLPPERLIQVKNMTIPEIGVLPFSPIDNDEDDGK